MPPTPEQEALLQQENMAILATIRQDGSAQLSPINYAYQNGRILISTTRDRAKYTNVRRNSQVSLCVIDPKGRPYVTVSGRAEVKEQDIAEGTATVFRRISDRPLPDNFQDLLREQRRVLIIVSPQRFVP